MQVQPQRDSQVSVNKQQLVLSTKGQAALAEQLRAVSWGRGTGWGTGLETTSAHI